MKRLEVVGAVDHLMHNDDSHITLAPRAKDKDMIRGIAGSMSPIASMERRMIIEKLNLNVVLKPS